MSHGRVFIEALVKPFSVLDQMHVATGPGVDGRRMRLILGANSALLGTTTPGHGHSSSSLQTKLPNTGTDWNAIRSIGAAYHRAPWLYGNTLGQFLGVWWLQRLRPFLGSNQDRICVGVLLLARTRDSKRWLLAITSWKLRDVSGLMRKHNITVQNRAGSVKGIEAVGRGKER